MSPNNPLDRMWKQLQDVTKAVNEIGRRLAGLEARPGLSELSGGEPRSDIGPISGYLQDVYNLAPEVVRTEHVRFEIHVTNQEITFQTDPVRVDPEFAFVMRRLRITGWSDDDALTNFARPSITFNIEDQGRGRGGVFLTPVSISETANHNGEYAGELVWDSFYRFVAGASLKAMWSIELTDMPADGKVIFVASISGDVLRTRTLPGGAMITSQGGTPRG